MVKQRVFIESDPSFIKVMREIKKDFDFASDRRATKEIAKMLQNKKRRIIL